MIRELISSVFIRDGSGPMGERRILHRCLPMMLRRHCGFFLRSGGMIKRDIGSLPMRMRTILSEETEDLVGLIEDHDNTVNVADLSF
jgi:hypothetical protein